MVHFFIRFLGIVFLPCQVFIVSAQVNVQDSLALVALYNNTGGPNWTHHDNWLITDVDQWYGVELISNQVNVLNLSNNNLVGTLPNEFCDFTAVEYLYFDDNYISGTIPACIGAVTSINSFSFRNNQLTGALPSAFTLMPHLADVWVSNNDLVDFPDLTSLPEMSNMEIEGNRFTFEDIEPNVAISSSSFSYTPQDKVGNQENVLTNIFTPFSFSVTVGGASNTYQWYKDGQLLQNNVRFSGVTTPTLTNNNALLADEGVYTCQIKNTVAVFLTLESQDKRITINDTRLNDTIIVQNEDTLYCSGNAVPIFASTTSGLTIHYEIVSGAEYVSFVNDEFIPLGLGMFVLKVYTDGNFLYKPYSTAIPFWVLSNASSNTFQITDDLPVKIGDTLHLAVASVPALTYLWATPQGQVSNVVAIEIQNIEESDTGLYRVDVYDQQCKIASDSVVVSLFREETQLIIYELLTPNGDGKNEVFYIENLEKSPNTEVTIFNTWNQIVYHTDRYENNWDGGGLPVGNYYYLVREQDCRCKDHKGVLYIKR